MGPASHPADMSRDGFSALGDATVIAATSHLRAVTVIDTLARYLLPLNFGADASE